MALRDGALLVITANKGVPMLACGRYTRARAGPASVRGPASAPDSRHSVASLLPAPRAGTIAAADVAQPLS